MAIDRRTRPTIRDLINRWAFPLLGLGILLTGGAGILRLPIHHDIAWYFHAAARVLDGSAPYIDVIDVNPPLVLFVNIGVVALSRWLSLPDILIYRLGIFTIACLSLLLCHRLLNALFAHNTNLVRLLILLHLFLFIPFPGWEFGQREHLMLILTAPYLVAAALHSAGRSVPIRIAWITGIAAAIGFLLKPYFLILWLAVETVIVRQRGASMLMRPETACVVLIGGMYTLAVLLLVPGYLSVLRWAIQTYPHFHPGDPAQYVRLGSAIVAGLGTALLLIPAASDQTRLYRRILLGAAASLVLVVWLQGKGWDYHWLPVWSVTLTIATILVSDALQNCKWRLSLQDSAAILFATLLFILSARSISEAEFEWTRFNPEYEELVMSLSNDGSIYAITTTMQAAFPLVNYGGLEWTSRFNSLWMLPGIYKHAEEAKSRFPYHSLDELDPLEAYLFEMVIEDIQNGQPDLIIVDRFPPSTQMRGFDYLEYFTRAEQFRAVFSSYRFAGELGRYMFFRRVARVGPAEGDSSRTRKMQPMLA